MRRISTSAIHPRALRAILALSVASPVVARGAEQYIINTAGLYDSTSSVGSHVGLNGLSGNSVSYFNNLGDASGIAIRYTSNTSPGGNGNTAGSNAWYYDPASHNTFTIGLTGPNYTLSNSTSQFETNGLQISRLYGMDNAGNVAGYSAEYLGNTSVGNTAWIYTPPTAANPSGVTTPIDLAPTADGLIVYVKPNGTDSSFLTGMNSAGQVYGTSTRFDSLTYSNEGSSAWIYSGGVTTNIGLTTANYTGSDGETQIATVAGVNANGQAVGTSNNFARAGNSQDVYFYDPASGTKVIGLTGLSPGDPNYALSANYYSSYTQSAPSLGAVSGYSITNSFGDTAWVYKISTGITTVVTLVGTTPPHVSGNASYSGGNSGDQNSSISGLNASGQAIGSQSLYATATGGAGAPTGANLGSDAFFFNGTSTIGIGLTDALHTATPAVPNDNTNGHGTQYTSRTNYPSYLNDAGQVAGTSARFGLLFGSPTAIGQDAWYYAQGIAPDANGNNAITIGLATSTASNVTPSIYTSSSNVRNTSVVALNAQGLIVGNSAHYLSNGTASGFNAYLYTPGGTSIRIGLFGDSVHTFTAARGVTENEPVSFLNAHGLAAGTATRYTSAGVTNGQDAWLYDSTTAVTYPITLSVNTSTNAANATVQYLGDNGLLLGSYTKYDPNTNATLGTFAYAFTEQQGAFDLGINTINFTSAGWQQLASTFSADSRGDIVGSGTLANGTSTAVYVLQHLLLGDANLDGRVDLNDLNIVLNNLGITSSLRTDGNFDGAATIDLNDLNDVLNNLGTSLSSSAEVKAAESVDGFLGAEYRSGAGKPLGWGPRWFAFASPSAKPELTE